ncbi:MAG: DUF512 domain-containing protein [Ruminococcaceae bacterium]|nr:DUF512 domain-containing protein [Oscillospiraceae bacterium]
MKCKAVVKSVERASIAEDCGINPGDIIDNINGIGIGDILDFKYLTSDEHYVVGVKKTNGQYEEIEIYNDDYEQFGVEFESSLIDEPRRCRNKCIFCFMDQLPPHVRKTMVFKDDDYRLSFLQGNYVTLTNVSDEDIERIIRMRISPINVSVHATDGDVRKMMLGNKGAHKVLDIMKRLAEGGITMNGQIVLCPGVNDGEILKKTIKDLSALMPAVHSVSVVPVGISKHREGLYPLTPVTKEKAQEVIDTVEECAAELLAQYGTRVVYAADEFYIKAQRDIPPYESYEDFPQIENGVGMMAQFAREVDLALESSYEVTGGKKYIATGNISLGYMKGFADKIKAAYPEVDVELIGVDNGFFGEMITVTGLLCGTDIINALRGKVSGGELILARNMFKDDCMIFLDDTTLEEVEKELNVKVTVNEVDGFDFVECVLGRKGK